jgi:hypothetical protein
MSAGMAAGSVAGGVAGAEAQTANPLGHQWWPSPWGSQDQRGANNRMTPAKALEAAKLIKTGKVYQARLRAGEGHPAVRRAPPPLLSRRAVVGEIGQVGSPFDGLGHIGMVAGDGKIRTTTVCRRRKSAAPTA